MSATARRSASRFLLVLALGAAACDAEVRFSDSIDTTIDFADVPDSSRTMHSPYVVGARFDVRAAHEGDGHALVSSDPEVLAVAGDAQSAGAIALAPGMAEVMLIDEEGEVLDAVLVEVRMPTRAVLHAAAPVLLDRPDVPTEATAPRVVAGGEATFLVQYFDGATRLAGGGGLEAAASEGATVTVVPEILGEHRDWLRIDAGEPGLEPITLGVLGDAFTRIDVDVIDGALVADLDVLAAEDAREPDAGIVIASAYDLDGAPVYGVPFVWQLDDGTQLVTSDVVRYAAGPRPITLAATFGELAGEVDVRGGTEADDDAAGCTIATGNAAGWFALLVVVLGAARRRRHIEIEPLRNSLGAR